MEKKYDALLIQELNIDESTSRKYSLYTINVKYKDLPEIAKIRDLSTNRSVDDTRMDKMKKFITKNSSFYPPLVLSTSKRETLKYDSEKKEITLSIIEGTGDELIIIDGQHRLKSIVELLLDVENKIKYEDKIQNIMIIDYIPDRKRREVFIEINDNSKRVNTAVKERFKVNISNYISLNILNQNEDLLKIIEMDQNQTKSFKNFPYKFILKSNEILLKEINKKYEKNELLIKEIDKLKDLFFKLWNYIIEKFIKIPIDCSMIINEIVYVELFKKYKTDFNEIVIVNDNSIEIKEQEDFIIKFKEQIDQLFKEHETIGEKLKSEKKVEEKKKKIQEILGETNE